MKNLLTGTLFLLVGLVLASCSAVENQLPTAMPTTPSVVIPSSTPDEVNTPDIPTLPSPTLTTVPETPTLLPEPMETVAPESSGTVVIDHTRVALFEEIPDEFIVEAAKIRLLYRHASIGDNMTFGLNCLMNNFEGRRPYACGDFPFDPKYNRSNWVFQFRGNPGWIEKVDDFVREVESQGDNFDAVTFTLGYVDSQDGMAYPEISDPENFQTMFIDKLEALEAAHPDKIFIWWTIPLAREGHANTTRFNEMVRKYAFENNKFLIDIADIESHDPEGNLILDELGNPVIYQGYTDEDRAGHLNQTGRNLMARAFWVAMASLAGWNGAATP